MRLSNRDLVKVAMALSQLRTQRMPVKLACKLVVISAAIEPFLRALDRQVLMLAGGEGGTSGNRPLDKAAAGYDITGVALKEGHHELQALFDLSVEVETAGLTLTDLPDTMELTPETMELLEPLIAATPKA